MTATITAATASTTAQQRPQAAKTPRWLPAVHPRARITNGAKFAETCRAEDLTQLGYNGCCSGLTCMTGRDGVPICQ
jgi:hypothetical protein